MGLTWGLLAQFPRIVNEAPRGRKMVRAQSQMNPHINPPSINPVQCRGQAHQQGDKKYRNQVQMGVFGSLYIDEPVELPITPQPTIKLRGSSIVSLKRGVRGDTEEFKTEISFARKTK